MESQKFEELQPEIFARIIKALMVLSDFAMGDFTNRLDTDLPNPFGALFRGINNMGDALAAAHQQSSAYQRELEEKLQTIEKQRAAIRALSTPIIEAWEGVLCLPIVGVIDANRSAEMTESLLRAVVDKKARCAIIDITGIDMMDTNAADHFLKMAKAVQLLGVECVLTGAQPDIAQTLVQLGGDLTGIDCHRSLRDALQTYVITRWQAAPKRSRTTTTR